MTPIERVIAMAADIGFVVAVEMDPKTIVLREDVRAMCAEGKCHAYGKNWTCPPACGDLDECRSTVDAYRDGIGIIVQSVGQLEDSMDYETMMDTGKAHGERFRMLAEKIKEEYPSALCLGAGGCSVCKSCSYPQPCRFPEKAFSSMEAFGMLVSDVCTANHVPYYHGENTIAYVGCYLIK